MAESKAPLSSDGPEEEKLSKKPDDTDFQQQRLKAWQPLLTPLWVILSFVVIGVIFVPIGVAILMASNGVVEVEYRYDHLIDNNQCKPPNDLTADKCKVTFAVNITERMSPPIYVYYKLSNYYQNHRRYVKSRSDPQLKGETSGDVTTCDPLRDNGGKVMYPCGLIASSMFNDSISAVVWRQQLPTVLGNRTTDPSDPNWMKNGISWTSDREQKFKPLSIEAIQNAGWTTISRDNQTLPSVGDEDFIVWMRTAGLPTFRKLHRKITAMSLEPGNSIVFSIDSVYPVNSFDGTKSIVLSTTSWLGGKNSFLGYAYIIVGSICLFLALLFGLKHKLSPRPLGDTRNFNWPNQQPRS